MSLGNEQRKFAPMFARLILYAYDMGYEVTLGDLFRDPRLHGEIGEKRGYGHPKSCHKLKMAGDLNLFKDGKFMTDGSDHNILHDYWDSEGGAPRIKHDLNHYSLVYQGMR